MSLTSRSIQQTYLFITEYRVIERLIGKREISQFMGAAILVHGKSGIRGWSTVIETEAEQSALAWIIFCAVCLFTSQFLAF